MHPHTHTCFAVCCLKGLSVSLIRCVVTRHKWKPDFILTQVYGFSDWTAICQSESQCELTCQGGQRQCGLTDTDAHTHARHVHTHTCIHPPWAKELTSSWEWHGYLRENNMPLSWSHLIALGIHPLTNVCCALSIELRGCGVWGVENWSHCHFRTQKI